MGVMTRAITHPQLQCCSRKKNASWRKRTTIFRTAYSGARLHVFPTFPVLYMVDGPAGVTVTRGGYIQSVHTRRKTNRLNENGKNLNNCNTAYWDQRLPHPADCVALPSPQLNDPITPVRGTNSQRSPIMAIADRTGVGRVTVLRFKTDPGSNTTKPSLQRQPPA